MPNDDPNLDPAYRPGGIAAQTARQPLKTATLPGQGALDVTTQYGLTADTPLMNIRGETSPSGGMVYRDITQQRGGGFQAQPGLQHSAQDLIDSAIQGRREHEARRQNLINQLPYANKRTAAAITAQLHGIDSDERALEWEANQRRNLAHQHAEEMDKRLKTDRETEIDEQAGALMESLGQLDAMKRKGQITKDEYDSALLEYGSRYSLGTRHPGAGRMFEHFVTHADKENDLSKVNPVNARMRAAKLQANIVFHEGEAKKEEAQNITAKKSDVPYSKSAELQANKSELELLQQSFPGLKPQGESQTAKKQWKYNASTGQLE